jgi:hypothetical protein
MRPQSNALSPARAPLAGRRGFVDGLLSLLGRLSGRCRRIRGLFGPQGNVTSLLVVRGQSGDGGLGFVCSRLCLRRRSLGVFSLGLD